MAAANDDVAADKDYSEMDEDQIEDQIEDQVEEKSEENKNQGSELNGIECEVDHLNIASNNSAQHGDSLNSRNAGKNDNLAQFGIPQYCWTVQLNHKFSEKWRPLTMVRPNQIKSFVLPSVR